MNPAYAEARRIIVKCTRGSVLFFVAILLGSCESKDNSLIDTVGIPPILAQVALSPARVNSDTMNVGPSRQPEDLLTVDATIIGQVTNYAQTQASVRYSVLTADSLTVISQGSLLDDGRPPDQFKGDGRFSGKTSIQFRRVQVGTFNVEVSAVSPDGYRSNTFITPLAVFRGNHPPVISDLVAPDTLRLGNETQLLTLSIRASDQDGLADVVRVNFNSFKPDGSASGGNPFAMYDDGLANHGDAKAADGAYSLIISLPATTQAGTYRFEFQAFDRSNEASNVITHKLVLKQ